MALAVMNDRGKGREGTGLTVAACPCSLSQQSWQVDCPGQALTGYPVSCLNGLSLLSATFMEDFEKRERICAHLMGWLTLARRQLLQHKNTEKTTITAASFMYLSDLYCCWITQRSLMFPDKCIAWKPVAKAAQAPPMVPVVGQWK